MELQVKFIENLVSKYHITEDRQLGRTLETVPTRMNAPHYHSYMVSCQCQSKICVSAVMCYKNCCTVSNVTIWQPMSLEMKGVLGSWAGTENYTIIIKPSTACATEVATMF
jgi:hypothetical protein